MQQQCPDIVTTNPPRQIHVLVSQINGMPTAATPIYITTHYKHGLRHKSLVADHQITVLYIYIYILHTCIPKTLSYLIDKSICLSAE